MGSGGSKVQPATDGTDVRAQVIAELGGQYTAKIAALESKVSELGSSNQALEMELAHFKRRVQDEQTVAGEVFTAADTDNDGRLSAQEFGAMLQNTGFEWSWGTKRTEMLLGALDEDGDSSLDMAEFSKGLEQLVNVAEALLEQQHPTQPAVAAGAVAVGSRLDKYNYVEEMAAWARDPQQLLPTAVLLQANMAAIQAIGPAYLQQQVEQQQIDELTKAVEALKGADIMNRTRVEYQLAEAIQRKKKVDAKLAEPVARIEAVKLASAEAISPGLARDGERYTEALTKLVADEPGVLDEVNAEAAAMVHIGVLKVGDLVEAVAGGAVQRAQVRRVVAFGTYELSLWTAVSTDGQKYEAGFDTSEPKLVTLPRREIYTNTKHKQTLSKEACALAAGRAAAEAKGSSGAAAETTPAYLALLYSDAERTLPLLHDLGAEISTQQPSVELMVAPLKAGTRAAVKTLDKYDGDYSRLTDLARMTVQCKALKDVKDVLKMLGLHEGFAVLRIKNRLMLAFDASVSGGYRDLLLNLRCLATGHIVELQITLKGLIDVKAGGYASYAVARMHRLFERETCHYEGALGAAVLEGVRCGVVRELVFNGKASGLAAHFDSLLVSLRSPACGLRELQLVECDWPEGRTLSELVEALPARGLRHLEITDMQVGGTLPEALGDKCAGAVYVDLDSLGLTGGVPASLGKCAKLKTLMLHANQLDGPIPDELGQCSELESLNLQTNQLTGGVPASLGKCAKLKTLQLYKNELDGPIPDELGQCGELELLGLGMNKLTGSVPTSLGKCAKLKWLQLFTNQLQGVIPDELGQCGELEMLQLQTNQLAGGVPASLGKCAKLKTLALFKNQLEGAIPDELGQCSELEALNLAMNNLTGSVPASLGECTKLKRLSLFKNQLDGTIPDELGQCDKLEVLELAMNQLTGGVPASLGKCAKLKELLLFKNQLKGAVPVTELAALTALEVLQLHQNEALTITSSGVQALKEALPNAQLRLPKDYG